MIKALGTSGWRRWAPDEDKKLERLWRHDLFDEEIAVEMGRTAKAVRMRRERLGLTMDLYEPASRDLLGEVHFPQFENVTKAEARAISASAPPSGHFSISSRMSLTGSTAAMCVESDVWKRNPKRS